ncbi:serine/threonine protein kinase [Oscillatoria salina]|uniref:serine/threonine protein kinase n=1 Tax=Oscillatoria salina TaxID=331517 RepID=UPI0013B8D968|nr:serine/threonine-protein kinase [Oscillatoria salina]MBZ8182032.1 protein kinase [Oscillatoria salina IIICB1]NET89056.1 protein kinase [Kamptonema sp. SIO1D9]
MSQPLPAFIHCINSNCPRPYPQPGNNKFCDRCGTPLHLRDRYLPLQCLGSGGFAKIFTVWDLQKQTELVLKVLTTKSEKAIKLFVQEAAVLASLHHPGVPKVEAKGYFQVQTPQGQLYCLVMEKIDGQTLEDILDKYPQGCPEAWVLNWFNQAVAILHQLHRRKIIHRDIKPSNLMLRNPTNISSITNQTKLVLIDFGGAKQIGRRKRKDTSTRLFSTGYSPPEQIAGGQVTPATDFYALGQTAIELLTGKHPSELEDSLTGELRWQHLVKVNPIFANLLDDLIQLDIRKRPATARQIQRRLAKIPRPKRKKKKITWTEIKQNITEKLARFKHKILLLLYYFKQTLVKLIKFTGRIIEKIVLACLDTMKEMLLGAIGAAIGTIIGFLISFVTPMGANLETWITQQFSDFFPNIELILAKEMLLFGCAGLGTALGLTAAGGFGQDRRFFLAGISGFFSYIFGWLIWQIMPGSEIVQFLSFLVVAVIPVVLGFGLSSYKFVHTLVVLLGTGALFATLVKFDVLPNNVVREILSFSQPDYLYLGATIAFFAFLGASLGLSLGISYYLLVPLLKKMAGD